MNFAGKLKFASVFVFVLLLLQVGIAAYAADDTQSDDSASTSDTSEQVFQTGTVFDNNGVGDYVFEDDSLPCSENDPSYYKNMYQQSLTGAAWGSGDLTHQSRFSGYKKSYGIDVSYYQYDIDWSKVKASGIDFAIIRVGYRGYGNGALVLDDRFYTNLKGAKAAGVKVGVYFYTQAINTTEAKAEAQFVLEKLKGYTLDLPVYFDIESVDYDTGRLDSAGLSKSEKTALCTTFCDTIKAGGYTAGVYANKYWLTSMIDGSALGAKYPIWLAHYTTNTDYTGTFGTWQYTSSGSVDGIDAYVDMDVRYLSVSVGTPSSFKCTAISGSTATLTWSKVSGASGYTVYRHNPTTGDTVEAGSTTSTTLNATVYDAAKEYYVKAYVTVDGTKYYSGSSDTLTLSKTYIVTVTQTAKTSNQISMKWDAVSGAKGYEVRAYNLTTNKYLSNQYSTTNSITFTGLEQATVYRFTIRPYMDTNKTNFGVYCEAVDYGTKPNNLTNVTASTMSSYVTLSWTANSNSKCQYEVSIYNTSTGKRTVQGTTSSASYKVAGLQAHTDYTFSVRPFYTYGKYKIYGNYSDISATTNLAPVTVKSEYSCTTTRVRIHWNTDSYATGYKIWRYNASTGKSEGIAWIYDGDADNYLDTDLTAGTTYKYMVQAFHKENGKVLYGILSSKIYTATCPETVEFTSYKKGSGTVTLYWDKTKCSNYKLQQYDSNTKKWVTVAKPAQSVTSYTVTGLKSNTNYKYRIQAYTVTENGSKYSFAVVSQTCTVALQTPTVKSAYTCTTNSIRINWNTVSDATGYKIWRYNADEKKWQGIKYLDGSSVTTYLDKNLKAGTAYKYIVQAYRSGYGDTIYSDLSPKIYAATAPQATSFTSYNKTSDAVRLYWTKRTCSKYRIQVYNESSKKWETVAIVDSGVNNYRISGLKANTTYKYRIQPYTLNETGTYSSYGRASATYTVRTSK